MDLPKYLSLLKTGSLYFSRSDLLGDHFEGSFPQTNIHERERKYRKLLQDQDNNKYNEQMNKFIIGETNLHKLMLPRIYINCWHASSHESHAMWELYSQAGKGIAIRSTYQRLKDCLPFEINIGLVKYINYSRSSKDTIPEEIIIAPFFFKRRSYEHEKELRAIYFSDMSDDEIKKLDLLHLPDDYVAQQKKGYYFKVNLATLIEKIYVQPFIEDWLFEAISDITEKYGLSSKIILRSNLEKTPLY